MSYVIYQFIAASIYLKHILYLNGIYAVQQTYPSLLAGSSNVQVDIPCHLLVSHTLIRMWCPARGTSDMASRNSQQDHTRAYTKGADYWHSHRPLQVAVPVTPGLPALHVIWRGQAVPGILCSAGYYQSLPEFARCSVLSVSDQMNSAALEELPLLPPSVMLLQCVVFEVSSKKN